MRTRQGMLQLLPTLENALHEELPEQKAQGNGKLSQLHRPGVLPSCHILCVDCLFDSTQGGLR